MKLSATRWATIFRQQFITPPNFLWGSDHSCAEKTNLFNMIHTWKHFLNSDILGLDRLETFDTKLVGPRFDITKPKPNDLGAESQLQSFDFLHPIRNEST